MVASKYAQADEQNSHRLSKSGLMITREHTLSLEIEMSEKDNEQNSSGIRVFVYGTLKEGHGNWSYLLDNDRCTKLGRCVVTGPYSMYSMGFFPAVVEVDGAEDAEMVGEVFVVDEDTLDALDCLEGHPNWYERKQVDTPWKKAWMYVMPMKETYGDDSIIESGCWSMSPEEAEWLERERA